MGRRAARDRVWRPAGGAVPRAWSRRGPRAAARSGDRRARRRQRPRRRARRADGDAVNVETLSATLEVGGLAAFRASMDAADRATASTRGALESLSAVSKLARDTLQEIRMKADQAAQTAGVSDAIKR